MPAGKYVNKKWKVTVNNNDLSGFAFNVDIGREKERIDVSGFNAQGAKEFLPGEEEAVVTVSFRAGWGSTEPCTILKDLYDGGSAFPFYVQPFGLGTEGTSATNPQYGGTAEIFTNPVGGELGAVGEITGEFRPASNSVFAWGTA